MVDPYSGNKIPLPGELTEPDKRVFDNSEVAKPERRTATLDVKFGDLTPKNFE